MCVLIFSSVYRFATEKVSRFSQLCIVQISIFIKNENLDTLEKIWTPMRVSICDLKITKIWTHLRKSRRTEIVQGFLVCIENRRI